MKIFHLYALIAWIILTPVTVGTDLKKSVPWVAFMSVWSCLVGHATAYAEARSEEALAAQDGVQ